MGEKKEQLDKVFYNADEWLLEAHPELLLDSETHYLANQLKLAREALMKKLEEVL